MDGMRDDAPDIGLLGESTGPLWLFGAAVEHCRLFHVLLQNAHNYHFVVLQTEQIHWFQNPQLTQHLSITSGTSNSTIYGSLLANRHPPWLENVIYLDSIGDNVSILGLKDRGGASGPINQPGLDLQVASGWWDLIADINIPPGTAATPLRSSAAAGQTQTQA